MTTITLKDFTKVCASGEITFTQKSVEFTDAKDGANAVIPLADIDFIEKDGILIL